MPPLHFPEYAPDVTPFGEEESQVIQNVYPRKDGYGPVPSPSIYSAALAGPCRGFFYARNADGSITIFAGTSTKLYKLNTTDFTWIDVSKGAGTYTAVPTADNWQFAQFNNFVLAVQIGTPPQVFDLTSSTAFADLAGSPPQARYVTTVNRFVVLSGLGTSTPYRVQWSGLNAITTWTPGVSSSDFQDLPDGGPVRSIGGGEYGLITQDSACRRMIFEPGSSFVFQIERVTTDKGILGPLSLVEASDRLFFCGNDGFQMYVPGGYPQFIGKEKVDRTFLNDVDVSSPQLLQGAYDPGSSRVFFAYKSVGGMAGLFDKVLCYDFVLDRWSLITGWQGQYLAGLSRPGLTLENMDTIASGIITITGATSGTGSAIRLTLGSEVATWTYGLADTTHNKGDPGSTHLDNATQNTIEVYGVGGTTEANGNWNFTVVDSTHIELTGSHFSNAYTTGGQIGGAIDSLTFSLDDIAVSTQVRLAMFDSSNRLTFLTGPNLEALLDSSEHQMDGARRSRIKGFRPNTDTTAVLGSVGSREKIQDTVAYSVETAVNSKGLCPMNVSARLARGRLRIPAASVWTFASGIEPTFAQEGKR